MILTVDIGNSHTVLGIHRDDKILQTWRLTTRSSCTAEEYQVIVDQFFAAAELNRAELTGLALSSVVPDTVQPFSRMAENFLKLEPLIIGPGVKTGMNIRMENPKEVGADRIVIAVGAYQKFKSSAIIVDFGTATTVSAVSEEGDYLGGVIAPGISISTEALFDRAAKLPRIELDSPRQVIGKNTAEALRSGIIYGFAAQIEGLVNRFLQEMQPDRANQQKTQQQKKQDIHQEQIQQEKQIQQQRIQQPGQHESSEQPENSKNYKEKRQLNQKNRSGKPGETQDTPDRPLIIATGGLNHYIVPETDIFDRVEPHLSLEGLYHIARLNKIV